MLTHTQSGGFLTAVFIWGLGHVKRWFFETGLILPIYCKKALFLGGKCVFAKNAI
jgi:hypothetical protein